MDKAIHELSASALRRLLIKDVRNFIDCLDKGSTEELEALKERLREIFTLLKEKEQHEIPIAWGKNSKSKTQNDKEVPQVTDAAPPAS